MFGHSKLESKDVLAPFIVLLTLNIIFLLVWTLVDPMYWKRKPTFGLEDGLSSFGVCVLGQTSVSTAMASCLFVVLALCVVVLANYEAYKARKVSVEFSESKYVALAMICFLQVIVVGVPLIALVHTNPPAGYFVKATIITVLSLSLLFLIFIPKMFFLKEENKKRKKKRDTDSSARSIVLGSSGAEASALQIISTKLAVRNINEAQNNTTGTLSRSKVARLQKILGEEAGLKSISPSEFDNLIKKAGIDMDNNGLIHVSGVSTGGVESGRGSVSFVGDEDNEMNQEETPKSVAFASEDEGNVASP